MRLARERSGACVSIYLETTPVSTEIGAARIALKNALSDAFGQLEAAGLAKRRMAALAEEADALDDDPEFWARQARSLAVLMTPDTLRTFRLANRVAPTIQVADRFHLKPLLRALAHPHAGFILALSENAARLFEFFGDETPAEVSVPGMPEGAASAAGKASLNDRSHSQRIVGSEGKNVRLTQYARKVDAALRPILSGVEAPLLLAANMPVSGIFRGVCSYPGLLPETIEGEIDRMAPHEMMAQARPALDATLARTVEEARGLISRREGQSRATTDLSTAARAAVMGAVELLMVDMDRVESGRVDAETGAIAFGDDGAGSYGIADQIAMMALQGGARVLAVRAGDLPEGAPLAAALRFPV
jgi:hypothetical protein